MISLKEYNTLIERQNDDREIADLPNGIACPDCGKELVDPLRAFMLMSKPPQTAVLCLACGFTGRRNCSE